MKLRSIHRWARVCGTAALSIAAAVPVSARQEASDSDRQPREAASYAVPRATAAIAIDGVLDEPAWQAAVKIPLLYETRPGENIEPPVATDCFITYDKSALYVAFRAYDPNPAAIRAHLSDRDSAFNDDFVGIVLDPFNDERRGFEFFVNPLGVQMDLFIDDVGGSESSSWDAIWSSAGKVDAEGYVVELSVPFHQLRFPAGGAEQTWGFEALRFYPRGQRHRLSVHPIDRDINCYLCQASKLTGFEGISPGRNLEIVPTVTGTQTDERTDFPDGPLESGDLDGDPGVTVRWGVTPNLTLNGTVNPDFSQVEADVAQLDVNEQFALFFPERRPFFLEGADFFDTPFDAVFTRNVADPSWGLKLSGKQGSNALGAFVAQDEVTNLIFPGSEGSSSGSFDFETTDTVLRYRRDLGKTSSIGGLFTDRRGGDFFSRTGGVDGLIQLKDTHSFRFQLLGSETEYPTEIAEDFDQPTGAFSDTAMLVAYNYDTRNWFGYARYRDVGEDFRADLGFMPRVGTSFLLGGLERIWFGEGDDWYTRIEVGGDWDLTEDASGRTLEEEAEVRVEVSGPRQSFLFLGVGTRDRSFNNVEFSGERFLNTYFEFQPVGDFFLGFFGSVGDTIDFANTRPAEQVIFEPEMRYDIGKHLRASLGHQLRILDVDEGQLFEANLTQLRLVYQFNVRSFVRGTFQYTDIERDPELYVDEVDPKFERLFTQLLFSYKLNPQTVLFVGYSDTRFGDEMTDLTQSNRTFFLKLGYAWVL